MNFTTYNPTHFKGGAGSYAAQGICSICGMRAAEWQKANKAYCDFCKKRLGKPKKTEDNNEQ